MSPADGRVLDMILSSMTRVEAKMDEYHKDLNKRVRSLELWRSWATGIGAAFLFALTIVLRLVK